MKLDRKVIGPLVLGMILRINLLQCSSKSVTADGSLLSPTGGVNTVPPIQKNGYGNGYVKTMATGIWLSEQVR